MNGGKSDIFDALRNPIRRKIILLLGEYGGLRAKDLKRYLNIGSGQLYYHLNVLRDFIDQDEDKKYFLTKLGEEAYAALSEGEVPRTTVSGTSVGGNFFIRLISIVLFPKGLFNYIFEEPLRHLIEVILVIFVGGYLSYVSGYVSIIYIPMRLSPSFYASYLYLFINILVVFVVIEAASYILFGVKGRQLASFMGSVFSLIPIIILFLLLYLIEYSGLEGFYLSNQYFLKGIIILCEVYAVTLLASSISVAKSLKIYKASLVSLMVSYLAILLYMVFSGILAV